MYLKLGTAVHLSLAILLFKARFTHYCILPLMSAMSFLLAPVLDAMHLKVCHIKSIS